MIIILQVLNALTIAKLLLGVIRFDDKQLLNVLTFAPIGVDRGF